MKTGRKDKIKRRYKNNQKTNNETAGVNTYLPIITLKRNALKLQLNNTEWVKKRKRKTQWSAAYEKYTSSIKIHIDWKIKEWKNVPCQWNQKKRTKVAILVSDKMYFKTKSVKTEQRSFYDKGINSAREYNNFKYPCTLH